ncbi:MAG: hypothetical protein PHU66_02415 [Bacteroidaceae bacterium]|nr:hypothetical protein [Bacteroidaceae bacterium]
MAKITIVPVSGLGNRMRVVTSVVKAAPQIEGGVRIVWQPTWDFRARFDELFKPIEEQNVTIVPGSVFDSPATKDNLFFPMLLRKFRYKKEWRCFSPSENKNLLSLAEKYDSFYMDTCYALGPYEASDVRKCFKPKVELNQQILEMTEKFSDKMLGVHIRRVDNKMSIKYSPLASFRKRIDDLLEKGEADKIFLCTDDECVRDYFRKTYGERVLTRRISLNRNSLQGIQDAVVDLWSLSRTSHILGSYYSSFSDTAAELSGTPFEVIQQK